MAESFTEKLIFNHIILKAGFFAGFFNKIFHVECGVWQSVEKILKCSTWNIERISFIGELSKLPNIGKIVEQQLNEAEIFTFEELKKIGAFR